MIHDNLDSDTSRFLERRFSVLRQAFDWLRAMPADPPTGITELQGQKVYVNVHGYETLPATECRWESHRETVDIQYCIAGGELIHWLPMGALEPMGDYVAAKDAEHWHDRGNPTAQLRMFPGAYAIFLPNELHRPKVSDGTNASVRKLVVKIRASLLDGCFGNPVVSKS